MPSSTLKLQQEATERLNGNSFKIITYPCFIRRFWAQELLEQDCEDDAQIDLDVPRTISEHIFFRERYGTGYLPLPQKIILRNSSECSSQIRISFLNPVLLIPLSEFTSNPFPLQYHSPSESQLTIVNVSYSKFSTASPLNSLIKATSKAWQPSQRPSYVIILMRLLLWCSWGYGKIKD